MKTNLSPRESQVCDLLAQGLAGKEIAHVLSISEHTVKMHLAAGREKLAARNSTHAAAKWERLKIQTAIEAVLKRAA